MNFNYDILDHAVIFRNCSKLLIHLSCPIEASAQKWHTDHTRYEINAQILFEARITMMVVKYRYTLSVNPLINTFSISKFIDFSL